MDNNKKTCFLAALMISLTLGSAPLAIVATVATIFTIMAWTTIAVKLWIIAAVILIGMIMTTIVIAVGDIKKS